MATPRSPLAQGGVERHVMEVGKRFAAAGERVGVVCTEPGGPASIETRDGVRIQTLKAWPAKRDWCLAPGLGKAIGEQRPLDVVHVQSYHTFVAPMAMLRALRLGIPYVVTFHGGGHSSDLRNRIRRLHRRALRPLLARAERLVAVAKFEIEAYGEELRLPPEKFVLIPNGTDLAFNGGTATKPPGPPVLATIGRLERYKGHHRVIAAFPQVLERRPDARLMVIGTGPFLDELEGQARELGVSEAVEFTSVAGDDPEAMARIMRSLSLVVLLSDFETHPLVALESAAAGRRLLVADKGGLAELAEDGFARAIDPEQDPALTAEAILEELEKDPPESFPTLSSWDDCAAELLALYASIAGAEQASRDKRPDSD